MTQVWKQGDTEPPLVIVVTDDGAAVDLTTATEIRLRTYGSVALETTTVTGDADGNVTYEWQPGDTDTAGKFQAEVRVTTASGGKQTFPNEGYLIGVIEPTLAAPSA